MKKLIIALLCLMLPIGLISCGKEPKDDTNLNDVLNSENPEEAEKKLDEIREQQKDDKVDILLADTDNVTITCKGKGESAFGGIYITLEVVNKTDKDILVGVDKTSNNGVMVDALFGKTITANLKSESDLSVLDKEITDVKDFKGIFRVMNDSTGEMIEDNIEFSIE